MTTLVKSRRHGPLATPRVYALSVALVAAQRAKKIGARMRERRDELGMTQTEVADAIGVPSVTKDYVSRWERGVVEPSEAYLDLAAAALKMSVADLMAGPLAERAGTEGSTPDLLGAASDPSELDQLDRVEAMLVALLAHFDVSTPEGLFPSPPGVLAQRPGSSSSSARGRKRQATR